jgi:paraquat-inducible protein B
MTEAKPEIKTGRSFSSIWIIPLVAVVLGGYMVIHSLMTEGPQITVSFKNGEGLTAGKTKVKLRNVELGVVEDVRLSEDLHHIIATIKLDRDTIPMLREDTQFWVVRARIGGGAVSGLDTLLSGAYLELSPGEGAPGKREFVGLENPPLTPTDAPGARIRLFSDRAASVSTGDAVLFRGFKVGKIESATLNPKNQRVEYHAFIDAPYHDLLSSSVRFWNISGVSIDAGADGLKVSTGSMATILLGGVAFEVPQGLSKGEPIADKAEFRLYDSQDDILKNPYEYGDHFVVSFSQSLKGLVAGAPVTYRGIEIGWVERLMIGEMSRGSIENASEGTGDPIPVLIYLEPARMELPDEEKSVDWLHEALRTGVSNGMRATLNTGNLLTGAQYIDLDYYPGQPKEEMGEKLGHPFIPSIPAGLGRIEQRALALLDKLNKLPLDATVKGANAAIGEFTEVLESVNTLLDDKNPKALPAELRRVLEELRVTLKGVAPGSDLHRNLNSTLGELNRIMINVEVLTRTLSDQPNSLLVPVGLPADPIPEAP